MEAALQKVGSKGGSKKEVLSMVVLQPNLRSKSFSAVMEE
jgi:hypothetical protein